MDLPPTTGGTGTENVSQAVNFFNRVPDPGDSDLMTSVSHSRAEMRGIRGDTTEYYRGTYTM